ncbi:MAG: hypothetical protein J2P41_11150 [Blastocatellia bacterium]|nr:hypothetical protein [Blastocatellia bacterium]
MMSKNSKLEYEYSEVVQSELKRLIDSAAASQPAPSRAFMRLRWRLIAATLLAAVLTYAFVRSQTFKRSETAKDSINSPKSTAADGSVIITAKQSLQIVVEPVSETKSIAGHEFLVAPDSAVVLLGSEYFVFVEESIGRFRLRQVQIEAGPDGLTLIKDGLRAGERVVSHGAILLTAKIRQ